MRPKKFILFLLIASILINSLSLPVHAEAGDLRYSYIDSADLSAQITTAGLLSIEAFYFGYNEITTGAKITTYVQKKVLGLFWTKVNNGQPNNEWIDNCSGSSGGINHSLQLSSTGTYRVTCSFSIYATTGSESFDLQRTVEY